MPPMNGMNAISSHQPDLSVSCSRLTASARPKISQAIEKSRSRATRVPSEPPTATTSDDLEDDVDDGRDQREPPVRGPRRPALVVE